MVDSRYAVDKMIIQTTELIIFITPLENGKSYKRGKHRFPRQIHKFLSFKSPKFQGCRALHRLVAFNPGLIVESSGMF